MKTLVAGLGNPILSDDGVGWVVAQHIANIHREIPFSHEVSVESYSLAGIGLMEQMIGYDYVILVDSLNTGQRYPGCVVPFTLESLPDLSFGHSASAHDLSLTNALILGRKMNAILPKDCNVHIIAIEAKHVYEFGETLSPEIQKAVPVAVNLVMKLLENIQQEFQSASFK
jgi:hydrogenase maturation protease